MKKYLILGIVITLIIMLVSCKGRDQQTYIGYDTTINEDKSVYKQEISQIEPRDNDKKDDTKDNDKKDDPKDKAEKPTKTSEYSSLNNEKKGWGLKRNSTHTTPEINKATKELLEKYNALFVGDESEKVIYLTFDEGYENGYTPKILDTLKANNVKAAFFITGPYFKNHSDLVQRMVSEGHIVGNHTINHPSLPEITSEKLESEIVGLDRMFYDKYKINLKYMRPPKGEYSERVLAQLNHLGHKTVLWSFAYDDYDVNKQKGTDYAYNMIMNNLHNGAIYLLHAVSKDNTEVLDRVIKDIKAQGYEFKSLDQI